MFWYSFCLPELCMLIYTHRETLCRWKKEEDGFAEWNEKKMQSLWLVETSTRLQGDEVFYPMMLIHLSKHYFSSNEISFEQVSAPSLFSIASLSDTVFKGCGAYFCCEEQTNWSLSLRAVFAVFVHQCPFPCSIINTRVKGTTVSIWSLY